MWILRSARSMKTTKATTATTITITPMITTGLSAPVRPWLKNCASAPGSSRDDADEDDQRDAVADAARGDLLAEPHQEHRAADQRDDAPTRKNQPGSCAMPSASSPTARP